MAETNRTVNRQKLNDYQNQLVQETKSQINTAHRGVSRAAILQYNNDDDYNTGFTYGKSSAKDTTSRSLPKNEVSVMHLNLTESGDMWSDVWGVIKDLDNIDPIVNEDLKRLIGNCYRAGSYCEFLVGLYKVQEKEGSVLDFRRLCGDGFVMDSFYRQVREKLHDKNLLTDEWDMEEEDNDDVFDCYSDSEDDVGTEEDKYLDPNGFLQLSFDENLVTMWIDKIKTRHIEDKNHMMGLMAHNSLHDGNLKIIVNKGGDALVELCKNILESENNSAAVPLVRNTSALVKQLASHTDMWNADCVEAMLEAMNFWVPNNGRKEEAKTGAFEVTESRETVKNLVETLFIMNTRSENTVDAESMSKAMAGFPHERLQDYLETQVDESDAVLFVRSLFSQD